MPALMDILDACADCYLRPDFVAGPDGRDGASVRSLDDGGTLLVFRGTISPDHGAASFLDWLNDLRAELVQSDHYPGRVHKGFAASLDDLWGCLPRLKYPLTIAGHSKGGALAMLAAARLCRPLANDRRIQVTTFGAPMCGDYTFRDLYPTVKLARYVGRHDVVPHLPPWDYWHVGTPILPPDDWQAPSGIVANHVLETGYRPWICVLKENVALRETG